MYTMKPIAIKDLSENFFEVIGKEWMLVTAGNKDHFNTMTASWGGIGFLWRNRWSMSLSVRNVTRLSLLGRVNTSRSLFWEKRTELSIRYVEASRVGK